MSNTCKQCEKTIEEQFKFCPFCGFPVVIESPVDADKVEQICKDMIAVEPTPDQQKKAEDGFWAKIKKVGKKIPFFREAVALYFMLKDPKLEMKNKALAIGAILYFITPVDLIPDWIPVAGMLDDAAVIYWVIDSYKGTMGPYFKQADEWINKEADA